MDGAANPYLMQAGIIACGLEGIETNRDPGEPLDINMYELDDDLKDYKLLPKNLLDALRLFQDNEILRSRLGEDLVDSYTKLKYSQWDSYTSHLTKWEMDNTLDC